MPFFLPQIPKEENPKNKLFDSLSSLIEQGAHSLSSMSKEKRKKRLEESLQEAKSPEQFHKSLSDIINSPYYDQKNKELILKHAYLPRDFSPYEESNQEFDQDLDKASMENAFKTKEPSSAQASVLPELGRAKRMQQEAEFKSFGHKSTDYKRNEGWMAPIRDKEAAAVAMKEKTEHLLDLLDKGEINSPGFASMIEKLPILRGLLSPDTQEFEATLAEVIPSLTGEFRGRVLASEIPIALARLPSTLRTTEAGKRQIIKRMQKVAELGALPGKILTELIEEFPDKPLGELRGILNKRLTALDQAAVEEMKRQDELIEIEDPTTGEIKKYPRWVLEAK